MAAWLCSDGNNSSLARQQNSFFKKSHVGPNLERRTFSKLGPCSDPRLRDLRVDVQPCEIFEEQGITGDVLLLKIDKRDNPPKRVGRLWQTS